MTEKIPVFLPVIDKISTSHIQNALDLKWLGMGNFVQEFEKRIEDYIGAKHAVVVNTGTSALHLALMLCIKKGDEVITPSFNYVADHQAILMAGGVPVMCDIEEDTLGIDCDKAEKLITKKTKAIIPLHFAGIPCNQKRVYELADKYNLRIIEDSMHAFGTKLNGKKLGSYGDITCFSFDPVKIITSFDGGCVIVNSKEDVTKLQQLRVLGVTKDAASRYKNKRPWNYDVNGLGYRYHMTNINASMGISQIKQADEFIKSRQQVCQQYNYVFASIPQIKTPKTNFNDISPFIYTIRTKKRKQLIEHLKKLNIDTGVHFLPVHKHKFFRDAKRGDMKVTEKVCGEIMTLPLHSRMNLQHVQRVTKGVTGFFR